MPRSSPPTNVVVSAIQVPKAKTTPSSSDMPQSLGRFHLTGNFENGALSYAIASVAMSAKMAMNTTSCKLSDSFRIRIQRPRKISRCRDSAIRYTTYAYMRWKICRDVLRASMMADKPGARNTMSAADRAASEAPWTAMPVSAFFSDGASLTPKEFEAFLAAQPDLSPKAWPRYVRINATLPQTATNKILKRELVSYGITPPGGLLWKRDGQRYGSVTSRSETSAARNSS